MEGFCLLKTVEQKVTQKGVPFLDLSLIDSDGEIAAKFWDYRPELQGPFQPNDLVKVRGTISVYNGQNQLRVERIRLASDKDDIRLEDFVPCAPAPAAEMFAQLRDVVQKFANQHLRRLVLAVLDERQAQLLYWPAAYRLHHAVRGGLLWHTLSVLRLAQAVAAQYEQINAELLFAGAILHDVEKISDFSVSSTGLATGYTLRGNLMGHLVGGAIYLEQKGRALGTPEELLLPLQHMLISHHGKPEFGAAMPPMFLEAEVLSELDLLDARINEITAALEGVQPGEFTNRIWALDNQKFYRLPPPAAGPVGCAAADFQPHRPNS
jgi:3'-5' exoribonuclease